MLRLSSVSKPLLVCIDVVCFDASLEIGQRMKDPLLPVDSYYITDDPEGLFSLARCVDSAQTNSTPDEQIRRSTRRATSA